MQDKSIDKNAPLKMVAIGYDDLFDDIDTADPHSFLVNIPTLSVLDFLASTNLEMVFPFANINKHHQLLFPMLKHAEKRIRDRYLSFKHKHRNTLFLETYGATLCAGLALQNYTQLEEGDDVALCTDEYESIIKAVTYCNSRWTNEQVAGYDKTDLMEISIRCDLPIVEYKQYKDFRPQFYKAIKFFKFCETNPIYSTILSHFCIDHNANNWREYLIRLFSFFDSSLKSPYITIPKKLKEDLSFFNQYVINVADCKDLWDNHNALNYFRNHFLYPISDNKYLLLNPNFLVDKMYQGMKFDFFQTINNHGILNAKGKPYSSYPDFNSECATLFSEPKLLYVLMEQIFNGSDAVMFTGEFLKKSGVEAEPDLYLRRGKTLFLFEYKDVTLSDKIKYSHNFSEIKRAILDRICKYSEHESRKGAGQLHYSMEQMFLHHSMDNIDPEISSVNKVFPIIMTTDRSFSAIGVQNLVVKEYNSISQAHPINKPIFISIPIIAEIDTFIICSKRISDGRLVLDEMILNYLCNNYYNLSPFSTFVLDHYTKGVVMGEDEINFLFSEILKE